MMTALTTAGPSQSTQLYGPAMEFLVLGPVAHHVDDVMVSLGGPKQRAVLGMLIANSGDVVSVDALIGGVWGPEAPPSLRTSVHTYISNLRVIVGRSIERIGDAYRLDLPIEAVDALIFEQLVDEAVTAQSVNPVRAAELARNALALWRGRPYADIGDVEGLQSEIRRLDDLRLRAVEARIEADLELGRHRSVIGELEALTVEHPLNEALHAKLMLALYRDGRQADSLRTLARLRNHLADLGVEPTPALVELEDRILQHDSTLETRPDTRTEELAFLFTDIEGSTALWEAESEWMRVALSRHDAVISENVERQGGRVFKNTGDGVIAVFISAKQAVDAAAGAQHELAALDWGGPGPLKVRMAIDVGEVDVRSSDYFGKPMNRGSRLQASAHGGQILLSSSVQERLGNQAGIQTRNLGEYRLRGLGSPQRVFQLILEGLESDFPNLRVDEGADPDEGRQFGDAIRGYELRERVGVGRFCVVYRAYQPSIGREVALKVIPPTISNHPSFIRTFERDARLVAKLAHPHIVPLFDFWRDHAGAYIVMPYIPGASLMTSNSSRLPFSRVSTIMREIGSALAYAHRHGVIHRNVNPDCILFDRDQNSYLGGFEIGTRAFGDEVPGPHSEFAAPEVGAGSPFDERADIFSLGAVAALLITGQPVKDVDLDLIPGGDVVARATHPDPAQRFRSVEELLDALPADSAESAAESMSHPPTRNPFKGLAAFDEADAGDFFGRSDQIQQLVGLVESNRFVTVVGPSGSGKSSLVRAGLLPTLRSGSFPGSENWLSAVMLPGAHPFEELLASIAGLATESLGDMLALLGADDNGLLRLVKRVMRELDGDLLLVIDQFEELYTLLSDTAVRERFIRSLLEAVADPHSRLRVVITIRADFFDHPLLDDRLGPVVASTNLAVSTPSKNQLLETIEGPAAVAGLELEGGLAERVVDDVTAEPGGLPLMQFTLRALTEVSLPGWLTHEKYNAIGGVVGALSARATEVYQGLDTADQLTAQRIMLRLVSVSEENDDVRRRVRRSELESIGTEAGSVDRVLAAFGETRLLTFDRDPATRGPTVEVAHEALLREWDLFRSWVEDRRDELLIHRRLTSAIEEWISAASSPEHLPTEGRLAQFEEWAADPAIRMTGEEQTFLTTAIAHRDAKRAKQRRRRQLVLTAFAGAAAVALFLAGVARVQSLRAEGRELIAEAEANVSADPELSILLALEAAERFDTFGGGGIPARVTDVLRAAIDADRIIARLPHGSSVAVSADGSVLVTADELGDGTATVWSTSTFEPIATLDPVGDAKIDSVYARQVGDEMFIRSVQSDGSWDVRSWRIGAAGLGDRVSSDAFGSDAHGSADELWFDVSPDGTRTLEVIPGETGSEITVRDLATSDALFSVALASFSEARFLPDSRMLYIDGPADSREIVIVNAADGTELHRIGRGGLPFEAFFATMSPDGDRLAVGSQGGIAVVEVSDGTQIWTRSDRRMSLPVWLDESHIMVGGEGVPIIVDAGTGETTTLLPGHRGGTWWYQLIPGTDLVVSAAREGGTTLVHRANSVGLEIEIDRPIGIVEVDAGGIVGVRDAASVVVVDPTAPSDGFELGGSDLVVGSSTWGFPVWSANLDYIAAADEGASAIWSREKADWIYHAPAEWSVRGVSNDGSEVVISRGELTQVVRLPSGTVVGEIQTGPQVGFATFTADGSYIITTNQIEPPWAKVWDRSTLEFVAGFGDDEHFAWRVVLTPDASLAISSGSNGDLYIYDFARILGGADEVEALLRTIDAQDNFMFGHDVSGNGRWVVTTSFDEPARVWDIESGELLGTFGTLEPAIGFHPTEPRLYVAESGELRIYSLETGELLDQARETLTRDLSASECERYLHRPCDDG